MAFDLKSQITDALGAHGAWKLRLKMAAQNGKLDVPARDVARDDACAFGKWLMEVERDPAIAGSAEYRDVKHLHAEFHRTAGAIATKIENGDLQTAKTEIEGPGFKTASSELGAALTTWRRNA